jgi:hypothetical protein
LARRLFKAESIDGGINLDPASGTGIGVTGKITFREPEPELRARGILSVDTLVGLADKAFGGAGFKAWILLDRLDVAFAETHELETNALEGSVSGLPRYGWERQHQPQDLSQIRHLEAHHGSWVPRSDPHHKSRQSGVGFRVSLETFRSARVQGCASDRLRRPSAAEFDRGESGTEAVHSRAQGCQD